jgi:hypothetical protein
VPSTRLEGARFHSATAALIVNAAAPTAATQKAATVPVGLCTIAPATIAAVNTAMPTPMVLSRPKRSAISAAG